MTRPREGPHGLTLAGCGGKAVTMPTGSSSEKSRNCSRLMDGWKESAAITMVGVVSAFSVVPRVCEKAEQGEGWGFVVVLAQQVREPFCLLHYLYFRFAPVYAFIFLGSPCFKTYRTSSDRSAPGWTPRRHGRRGWSDGESMQRRRRVPVELPVADSSTLEIGLGLRE